MSVITVSVGRHYTTAEGGTPLHIDQELSPFVLAMLRTALDIAGDPEGTSTFQGDFGEGHVTLHMNPSPFALNIGGEPLTRLVTVDLIRREITSDTTA